MRLLLHALLIQDWLMRRWRILLLFLLLSPSNNNICDATKDEKYHHASHDGSKQNGILAEAFLRHVGVITVGRRTSRF